MLEKSSVLLPFPGGSATPLWRMGLQCRDPGLPRLNSQPQAPQPIPPNAPLPPPVWRPILDTPHEEDRQSKSRETSSFA